MNQEEPNGFSISRHSEILLSPPVLILRNEEDEDDLMQEILFLILLVENEIQMISCFKTRTVVQKDGRVEIESSELIEGEEVEVIIMRLEEQDTTEYLLSTEANRLHLRESLREIENKANFR